MQNLKVVNIMPQESKDKWVAALRSGDYKQGVGCLYTKTDNAYCCLGVLQHCLTGEVEVEMENNYDNTSAVVPTAAWLDSHNIKFSYGDDSYGDGRDTIPWLVLNNGDIRNAAWFNIA
jgi:hypothetical protein